MFDLKVMNSVLGELEEERGIPREKVLEAIEAALATALNASLVANIQPKATPQKPGPPKVYARGKAK